MKSKSNHNANISTANVGTKGTNITYSKAQGNKGALMNPNNKNK
jgi:hypothetical protein